MTNNHQSLTFYSKLIPTVVAFIAGGCGPGINLKSGFDNNNNNNNNNTPKLTFTPSSGPVGSLLYGYGTDFTALQAVAIGATSAVLVSQSSSFFTALVMPNTTSSSMSCLTSTASLVSASTFAVTASLVPYTQQGSKWAGTGATGNANQGKALAVSADGNTMLVGGPVDSASFGAVWVYTRSSGTWSQQGSKLNVGTASAFGSSVSLSADGNTALVGGNTDNASVGAAWVYTRSNGSWTQQAKLIGTGFTGSPQMGKAVALSADGNTAIVGGIGDNSNTGAVWIFTRSSGTWSQQGAKWVGSTAVSNSNFGSAVAVSADGNTFVAGGSGDATSAGALWFFTRSNGLWSQQGSKLVGTGASGSPALGTSVALSADGNTAMGGGPGDSTSVGAAWVFTRSSGTWTQQGSKLVGTSYSGTPTIGTGIALSADGNTAYVGGPGDNSSTGAFWIFTRSGSTWSQYGAKTTGTTASVSGYFGSALALSSDGSALIAGGYGDTSNIGAVWYYSP